MGDREEFQCKLRPTLNTAVLGWAGLHTGYQYNRTDDGLLLKTPVHINRIDFTNPKNHSALIYMILKLLYKIELISLLHYCNLDPLS